MGEGQGDKDKEDKDKEDKNKEDKDKEDKDKEDMEYKRIRNMFRASNTQCRQAVLYTSLFTGGKVNKM